MKKKLMIVFLSFVLLVFICLFLLYKDQRVTVLGYHDFTEADSVSNMQMNIKTERKEDDLWGTIEMSFNNMWFLDSAPSEWKDIWNNLMKEAQRVYIEAKDNMIMYQYYYDLTVEVPCVQTQYK